LESKWTNKEVRQLYAMLAKANEPTCTTFCNQYFYCTLNLKKGELIKRLGKRDYTQHSGYANACRAAAKLLYVLPLEDVPLYINRKTNLVRTVAKWRLMIAK